MASEVVTGRHADACGRQPDADAGGQRGRRRRPRTQGRPATGAHSGRHYVRRGDIRVGMSSVIAVRLSSAHGVERTVPVLRACLTRVYSHDRTSARTPAINACRYLAFELRTRFACELTAWAFSAAHTFWWPRCRYPIVCGRGTTRRNFRSKAGYPPGLMQDTSAVRLRLLPAFSGRLALATARNSSCTRS